MFSIRDASAARRRGPVLAALCKGFLGWALLASGATVSTGALGATTTYEYDALGRLRVVTHDNGNVTTYQLDAAGNRTNVSETSGQAPPASLSVPATSLTGSYTVTWSGG